MGAGKNGPRERDACPGRQARVWDVKLTFSQESQCRVIGDL